MTTELSKVVTYDEVLPVKMFFDSSIKGLVRSLDVLNT